MKAILGKLHLVMTEVDYIQKDGKNSFQKYSYASEYAIKEKFHEAFTKHKIIFQFSTSNVRIENGLTFLDCAYAFHDVESGESLSGTFVGSGAGRDEKGNYAAVTGAIKYILTSNFIVPTGDDPEDDKNEAPTKTTAPKVAKTVADVQSQLPKSPVKEFSATKEQFEQILDLASIKLAATEAFEIIPRINDALGTKYVDGKSLTRSQATDIITKLTNL